jgi:poly(beta-D-mannuronate) C5 epimerase
MASRVALPWSTGRAWPARLLVVVAVAISLGVATGRSQTVTEARSRYVVEPAGETSDLSLSPVPRLAHFNVDAVADALPRAVNGRSARLVPIDDLYFLHASNMIEMNRVWRARGVDRPRCLLLSRGSYDLDSVRHQIGDDSAIAEVSPGRYVVRVPIYIAPTAHLVIRPGEIVRLSVDDGVFIYSNGELSAVGAEIVAFDVEAARPAPRAPLSDANALFYGSQQPRPYILASEGSVTRIAGSRLVGLGYKGTTGTFGLSMTPSVGGDRLGHPLQRLAAPTGVLVGNRIERLFFGYYSNRAEDVAIVGNLFKDNVIYGIDPHDYTERLIAARNVSQGARFAHGIIFSRGVSDGWVAQNLVLANQGSGVMMDRESSRNLIEDNLILGNRGDGIAIFESDDNLLRHNVILRNRRNGVLMRNSTGVQVLDNDIARNGRSAVEIAAEDISELETRNFVLDPFRQEASAVLRANHFRGNARSAVSMRDALSLTLVGNRFTASGPLYFDGDLVPFAPRLIESAVAGDEPLRVHREHPAESPPIERGGGSAAGDGPPTPVLLEHARNGVPRAMLALARHYYRASDDDAHERGLFWYARAIQHARISAMSELGVLLAGHGTGDPDRRHEGLVLLELAARLGDAKAARDLRLLPDLFGVPESALERAASQAAGRLRSGRLWNAAAFPEISIRLGRDEALEARRRIARLLRSPPMQRPLSSPVRTDPDRLERYQARIRSKNALREDLQGRIERERLADARATGERRAYLDRVRRRDEAARLLVESYDEGQWQAIIERIRARLVLINRHRAADDPITENELALPTGRDPNRR